MDAAPTRAATRTRPPTRTRTGAGFWSTFLRIIGLTALVVIVVLAIALQGVPRLMGGTSLTVLTGSMQPSINPGDVVAVRAIEPRDIRVGDVVTFQPVSEDTALITHRVISKGINTQTGYVFTTQGDANSAPDAEIIGEQVNGVVMYTVPFVGYALNLVGGNGPVIVTGLGIALLVFAVFAFLPRRRRPHAAAIVLVAVAVAATSIFPTATPASAAAISTDPPADDGLDIDWDGPTINLDARGQPYATIDSSFFGTRVMVPGDHIQRSVVVQNSGPEDGALSVWLKDFRWAGVVDLDQRVTLGWTTSQANGAGVMSSVVGSEGELASGIPLARGDSLVVTLTLDFPISETGGARAEVTESDLAFDMQFRIVEADLAGGGTPLPALPGPLPITGGAFASGALVLGVALLAGGLALISSRRRPVESV